MTKAAKDRPWWINPGYDAQENVELDALNASPAGSYELLDSPEDRAVSSALRAKVDEGEFSSFAALLFMINGHRPGPVRGFYVVVETVKGSGWCVGQLRADGATPLRVFRNPVYPSVAEARRAAEALRLSEVGNAPPRI